MANDTPTECAKSFVKDLLSGEASGFLTGLVVGTPEYLKVQCQSVPREQILALVRQKHIYVSGARNSPKFALLFAQVCGLEFSVDRRIEHNFGSTAGVVAAATTGSLILTAADHIMFLQRRANIGAVEAFQMNRGRRLFTGFVPMFGREAAFITSMLHLGPFLGDRLRSANALGDCSGETYVAAGRYIAQVPLTLLTHPFDSVARELQKELHRTGKKPNLRHVVLEMRNEPGRLMYGALPRVLLAPVGLVLVGYFFDKFNSLLEPF